MLEYILSPDCPVALNEYVFYADPIAGLCQ